ncbi:hypothetical protein KUTeg_024219 [Tegillarca granosa]|uniref:Uncharacterized protein n=1 Tax=Tegillarca granosa TaxID=220873 RepID=A0ABQ9E321_TEGGR|nr:hypothetical protein KUTeg_024219 [Tegillarca granosa]
MKWEKCNMVIVLSHTVVASILYYRNPQKFLCGGSSNLNKSDSGGEGANGSYEDVTTKLAQVQNFRDLHSVVPDAIESLSSQSVCCIVFLQDVVQEEFAAKQTRKTQRREEISPNDPITALLKQCNNDPAWIPKNVVCQPVVQPEDKTIIAVIVACHKSGSEVDRKILSFIEKQILACYRRELYDQDATILQLKVLKFLEEQTKAEYAFLLLVAPETQELFCQVVGDKVLDVEVRFPNMFLIDSNVTAQAFVSNMFSFIKYDTLELHLSL